jgi:hypothetical protein
MGQLKHRFLILGLSLLVLVIALAGLLGVLDTLPEPGSSAAVPGGNPPTASGVPQDEPGDAPVEPPEYTPPEDMVLPISLPENFSFDISRATSAVPALEGEYPPHYPIFEVSGAEDTQYLKSMTASYFDGAEWLMNGLSGYIPYNGDLVIPPGIEPDMIVTDNISVSMLVDIVNGVSAIPTSLYPTGIDAAVPLLYFPDDMTFLTEEEFPEQYIFDTIHYIFDRQTLANADLDMLQEYLQLPDNITPRTYELAANLTGGIESPFLMAKALEDYLKTSYAYDYEAEAAPEGWEPNDYFLFESKSGVCTNFNSAFVILCRAAGIPARLAGGFAVTPQEEPQVVYADQAHAWAEVKFEELGWYTFDATGSAPPAVETVTEVTAINGVAEKGEKFTVSGTVWTESAKPADGVLVEVLVNSSKSAKGAVLVGKGIVTDGHFEIEAVIPGSVQVGQYHVLAHSLDNGRYNESWSDPIIKVVSGTEIMLGVPSRVKIGQPLEVNGYLTGTFGDWMFGQRLDIYINGELSSSPVTDSYGSFEWAKTFHEPGNYVLQATFAGSDYYLASTKEAEFRVLAPAVLTIDSGKAKLNTPYRISGRFAEETGTPLPGLALSLTVDGVPLEGTAVTADSGKFEYEYCFPQLGRHRVAVNYAGDDDYYKTSAAADIEVVAGSLFSPWILIFAALGLAALGVGGWYLYRWLKNRPILQEGADAIDENDPKAGNQTAAALPWQSSGSGLSVTLGLPQITTPLPDVWGINDELLISVRLTGDTGAGISAPVEITINGEAAGRLVTGPDGAAEMRRVFAEKGQYELVVKYEEGPGLRNASAGRTVRIVDYREEIVDLFNRLLDKFRETGVAISNEFTPRKIQYLVLAANIGVPEKALEDVIYCFEETDYSLHAITRRHYEIMYLAQKEIREHGVKPAAAD